MSIRYKIALLFALLVSIHLVTAGVFVYMISSRERQDALNERLKKRALATARIYQTIQGNDYSILNNMDAEAVASLGNRSISVLNDSGTYEYFYVDAPRDSLRIEPERLQKIRDKGELFFTYKERAAFALYKKDSTGNFILAISASDLTSENYLRQLVQILIIAGISGTLLSFLTGLLFAKSLIRPIRRIIGEVNLISTNNLSQRLQNKSRNDELSALAQTLNTLLDRMQESFTIQRRFISNASHELSTPLTSISSQLEVALQKKRTDQEYRNVVQSVLEDIRDLQLLTRSLLDIAKTGAKGSIDLDEIRLDEVLLKAAADVQKINDAYNVVLDFDNIPEDENGMNVFGNANLLYIAYKNIIENGCKYSHNHTAFVTAAFGDTEITVSVSSIGDIIAAADIHNIFQPFFRTESARPKQGFGLGLTLTKRIFSLHHATITVSSNPESGTVFTTKMPTHLPLK